MTDPDLVLTETNGTVARLTLNRPEKRNALNSALLDRLFLELRRLDRDRDISVIVIAGAGSSFSSGFDISVDGDPERARRRERADTLEDWQAMQAHTARWLELRNLATPTVAQVHGYCLGGGAELALMCDLVVASTEATIGHPVVRDLGVPTLGLYPYLVGMRLAKEMMLTGRCLSGVEAADAGLINRAVVASELSHSVDEMTARMAGVPKPLLAFNKRAVDDAWTAMGIELMLRGSATFDALAHTTPEVRDVVAALSNAKSIGEARGGTLRRGAREPNHEQRSQP